MRAILLFVLALTASGAITVGSAWAQGEQNGTRMLRYPDIHENSVVFSYAGDIWLADISSAEPARRVTSHPGLELYPRFSPDGRSIAFTGQYRGDEQVYIIDLPGGEPRQLTYFPTAGPLPARWGTDHQVYGWSADGKSVLFRSMRQDFNNRRLYLVPVDGGLPRPLPMPRAGSGDFSPDGGQLVYSPLFRDFRTWKRYQGGWSQDLYVWDMKTNQARQITDNPRTDRDPVWLANGIHFVSDRDGTLELFRYDPVAQAQVQLTHHTQWDIKWASGDGSSRIVYEIAGRIGLYDTRIGTESVLSIEVPDDGVRRTARRIDVSGQIEDFELSPDGKRVLIGARGDVFSVPVEHGVTRNLTRRGDAHDREAQWSPDGRHVAFVSDRNGEEQVFVVPHDGGDARALTKALPRRLYRLRWAPDSQRIAFRDHTGQVSVVDLQGSEQAVVRNPYDGINDYVWSPDSAWLGFSQQMESGFFAVDLWSRASGEVSRATDGFFNAFGPEFSLDGKHLFFVSDRQFAPQIGSFEWNYVANRESGVFALALAKDSGNPFGPRNDEVEVATGSEADGKDGDKDEENKDGEKPDVPEVKIDLPDLSQRLIRLPIDDNEIYGIQSVKGGLLYLTGDAFYYGRPGAVKTTLHKLDFEKRESDELASDVQDVSVAGRGTYVAIRKDDGIHRLELANPKETKKVGTGNLVVYRAPADEWPLIFDQVWRRFRDYFYVSNMHGYDWDALRDRYRPLVGDVSTREDLNTLIGEMIAELNVGHAYVAGGDLQAPKRSSAALLGARFKADTSAGRYQIGHVYPGHNAEPKYRSPLTEVGVDASEGDYVLAIDGQNLTTAHNPYDLLTDRGKQPVELTVSGNADGSDPRRVLVDPIDDESNLIYLEWVEGNRQYVLAQTDGQVGYLHIPDMGSSGIYEFIKWFYPQIRKNGLIVDVRGNGGGNVSQMILRRLMLKPMGFGYQAHSDWVNSYPRTAFAGPMVSLISEDSASDGDIFPYFFREAGLGPLIGKKTWGGVVGISGHGPLIDGGQVYVPEYGMGQAGKGWIIEGEGVSPDIEVANDPASDTDAQLDRGISEVMARVRANPPAYPSKPPPPVKTQ